MSQAINLFGKMLTFSRLKINTDQLSVIHNELTQILQNSPIVNELPVVIDSDVDLELDSLIDMLWLMNVQPIGVVSGVLDEQARDLRLAIFPTDGKRIERLPNSDIKKPDPTPKQPEESSSVQAVASNTQSAALMNTNHAQPNHGVHAQMLRSGQSLQHLGGDLTIIGGVNDGAEAITDSSLHIYGRGLGRLVAGATGDKDARIFCQKFNPSLVSVAGTYCLREAIPQEVIDKAVQVTYDENKGLVFTLLTDL